MGFRSIALLLLVSGLARVTAEVRSSSHCSLVLRTFAAHTTCYVRTHTGVKTEPFSKHPDVRWNSLRGLRDWCVGASQIRGGLAAGLGRRLG